MKLTKQSLLKVIKVLMFTIFTIFLIVIVSNILRSKKNNSLLSYDKFPKGSKLKNEFNLEFEEIETNVKLEAIDGRKEISKGKYGMFLSSNFEIEYIDDFNITFLVTHDKNYVKDILFGEKTIRRLNPDIKNTNTTLIKSEYSGYQVNSNQFDLSEKAIKKIENLVNEDNNFYREHLENLKLEVGTKWEEKNEKFKYLSSFSDSFIGNIKYEITDVLTNKSNKKDLLYEIKYNAFLKGNNSDFLNNSWIKLELNGFIYYSTLDKIDRQVSGNGRYKMYTKHTDFFSTAEVKGEGEIILSYKNNVAINKTELNRIKIRNIIKICLTFLIWELILIFSFLGIKHIKIKNK